MKVNCMCSNVQIVEYGCRKLNIKQVCSFVSVYCFQYFNLESKLNRMSVMFRKVMVVHIQLFNII